MDQSENDSLKGKSRGIWIIAATIIILLIAGAAFYYFKNGKKLTNNLDEGKKNEVDLSQLIQADFIDLDKIAMISKFRSGSGHDFSGNGETCRSMKHYFAPPYNQAGDELRSKNNGMPPGPDGKTDISIFSPVDGKITGVQKEQTPIGEQIYIEPDSTSKFTIRLFHIYLDPGIKKGSTLKAGQKIGVIGQYSSTDIAIQESSWNKKGKYYSYFEAMPDDIFSKYQAKGIKSREELIFTKEYRDANPLQCNGEQFSISYDSDPNSGNYVYLSGYNPSDYSSSGSGTR
ncbi:MAG: hypothetical protein M1324_03580 [Patescibacteria group bacterium]|nr:hypothetical protein [Patescibacteria group bacterium]